MNIPDQAAPAIIVALAEKVHRLSAENDDMSRVIERANADNDELTRRIAQLNADNSQLNKDSEELRFELAAAEGTIAKQAAKLAAFEANK